jgi:diaminopimelate decarboxylase
METLDLFPLSTTIGEDGGLRIAGNNLTQLAQKWGTPLYLYDGSDVWHRVQLLKGLLNKYYTAHAEITYAAKAYFSLAFAKHIRAMDIGVDVVSQGELMIALHAGFKPDRIHLHGNNKSLTELMTALSHGIQAIVVDCIEELLFIENLAKKTSKVVRIWLRLTPGIEVDTHAAIQTAHPSSKFGIHIAGGEAAEAIRISNRSQYLDLKGLHIHLGSQIFDPDPYREAVNLVMDLADSQDYIPEEISTGGGWGVSYHPARNDADPGLWVGAVTEEVQKYYSRKGWALPKLVLEPGRWLTARAGIVLYSIGSIKKASDGTNFISVDGGMADNPRPALYQAVYSAVLTEQPKAPAVQNCQIVGRYCETGDQLISNLPIPEVKRGDILAVPVSGAYQLSMASNYNLTGRPAVLWLDSGKIERMQPREIPEKHGWWVD